MVTSVSDIIGLFLVVLVGLVSFSFFGHINKTLKNNETYYVFPGIDVIWIQISLFFSNYNTVGIM